MWRHSEIGELFAFVQKVARSPQICHWIRFLVTRVGQKVAKSIDKVAKLAIVMPGALGERQEYPCLTLHEQQEWNYGGFRHIWPYTHSC